MNVFEFLKPTKKAGGPAAQIAEMQASLEKLRAERAEVQKIIDGHESKRAEALLSDMSEEAILELDRQCDLARLRLERAGLAEFELESRIESARDASDRQRKAAALEQAASAIEAKVAALEKASDALAIAIGDFIGAIPNDLIINKVGHGGHPIAATPAEIASAVVAQGLLMSSSLLFEPRKPTDGVLRPVGAERALVVRILDNHGRLVSFLPGLDGSEAEILPTSLAAEQILVDRLRAEARRLRDSDDVRRAAE